MDKQNTFILEAKYSKLDKKQIYSCIPRSREAQDISYDGYTLL